MNTMFYTKIVGGLCGSFLILLLLNWASDEYFFEPAPSSHNVESASAYSIAVEIDDTDVVEDEVVFADILALADAAAGQRVFNKCKACHKLGDGENTNGPTLYQIVGRVQGDSGFESYSGSLPGGIWSPEELNAFLIKPSDYAPGTSMGFAGLKKDTDRANLVAYLQSLQ